MLDKLDYFKKYGEGQLCADQAENAAIMELLKEYYRTQGRNVIITPGEKGTLGVTFLCRREEDASGAWFVKSHQPQKTYRDALKREAVLLKAANGDELDVSEISAKPHGGGYNFMCKCGCWMMSKR